MRILRRANFAVKLLLRGFAALAVCAAGCAAQSTANASKVWRFAHTYSTAKNGFWSTPRGNVSQDGRFFMFTSDWQDQLGKLPGSDKYRTDVFIVELK
jgi:hypothetical protein